ncbi:TetR family transcriptional regulator [Nannocystis sp. ILAH1]|uniref:TetR/AcrR family transcriptional regulator n=1 Tax=unclassified Nannocystis TaxID=2627009 RepID=UPI00226DF13F|nr:MULTISPECIES: TetR family transcriptional regulator [unclassified Nannocystis]MCY0994253.1 TetR family transcriptional regulator [Nannocystis sp. ILAH1]MCY1064034.1 TetR family transcriptional regulator [Nannocystis sp. RBIL2]
MVEVPPKRRARADADKQSRRRVLLCAAAEAFDEMPYNAVTVADIARRANLAKGTVYLYFATKEELFLQLALEQLGEWLGEVEAALTAGAAPVDAEALAELLARSLAGRVRLARLLALQHAVLEHNVAPAVVLAWRRAMLQQMLQTAALLERRCPALRAGEGLRFFLHLHAAAVGLHQMTHPAPELAATLTCPTIGPLRLDFATALQAHAAALLRGLQPDEAARSE